MARPKRSPRARRRNADVPVRCVVYVHGICHHDAGYSNDWWDALLPHLGEWPADGRREVLWSDLVNSAEPEALTHRGEARARVALELLRPSVAPLAAPGPVAQIKDILADRTIRQSVEAALETAAVPATARAGSGPLPLAAAVTPEAFLGIPGLDCVDDFGTYLTNDEVRQQVIDRFRDLVRPLLAGGAVLEVISHSWGTVVAYEALCQLEQEALPDGAVHTFFTVGSALSIAPVRHRLLPEAANGHKPRLVRSWINLDAKVDVVGGALRGVPFEVDYEYLGLAPVGCSMIFPQPSCAHGSYFRAENVDVNRDLFAGYILA